MSLLGNRVIRTEDPKFLTGRSEYVADLDVPGAAHVVFVRSVAAHANLTSIDTSEAAAMPGVIGVFTMADIEASDKVSVKPMPARVKVAEEAFQPLLAKGRVRYVGEPVVAIVAETVPQGVDAAELVMIDYDWLPAVVTMEAALEAVHLVHDAVEGNIAMTLPSRGPLDFSECETVVEATLENQRMAVAPIEARVGAADWTGDRALAWSSCQGAGPVLNGIAASWGLDEADIRVIAPDVGGGFGAKGSPNGEEILLPGLSRMVGRPVRWAETRSENMVNMVHGRGQRQMVKVGGTAAGRITHYEMHVIQDCGAYAEIGVVLPTLTMMMASGTYDIENVAYSSQSVLTNTTPIGAFRGAGRPEATAAIERAVDIFAAEVNIDSAEVRRLNLLPRFDEPHTNATGTTYDNGDYPAALEKLLAESDYAGLRAEQQRRIDSGDRKVLGVGIASYVEITAIGGPDGISEFGSLELKPDGGLIARTGSTPHGQGHVTTWAMIISDRTGVPMDQITVQFGDTDDNPGRNVTGGSRSAQIAGSAMHDSAVKLIDQAKEQAATLLEASVADVVLDPDSGQFHVAGTPARGISWEQIGAAGNDSGAGLLAVSDFVQPRSSFPFGAHCSVVEVDLDIGQVKVLRHIAVDDCGTLLNPLLADGQVHGGIASGVAQALIEEIRFDDEGTPLTSNFADYGIISSAELPSFERIEMVTPSPLNPLGAKGIGEAGTIGATPAVHNAVVDAVRHLGVRHIDMPCTAEKVWRAIQATQ